MKSLHKFVNFSLQKSSTSNHFVQYIIFFSSGALFWVLCKWLEAWCCLLPILLLVCLWRYISVNHFPSKMPVTAKFSSPNDYDIHDQNNLVAPQDHNCYTTTITYINSVENHHTPKKFSYSHMLCANIMTNTSPIRWARHLDQGPSQMATRMFSL